MSLLNQLLEASRACVPGLLILFPQRLHLCCALGCVCCNVAPWLFFDHQNRHLSNACLKIILGCAFFRSSFL
ncbi:hypothetical protein IWZ03DRAFT_401724 [Phyllosticta citriasiana]|uniref:Secreted protein n=1 Tax=Phyllosticta citriasiana TaxID=595635 RepID=A0ABR1KB72_9PEZI